MKPLIGVTTFEQTQSGTQYAAVSQRYLRSVLAGGGLPIALPTGTDPGGSEAYLDRIDALLLIGGGDIDPAFYGEEQLAESKSPSRDRDEAEIALARAALARGMPILGICRGHQLLNVAMGGSLYQDIASQIPVAALHNPKDLDFGAPYHRVDIIDPGSRLFAIFGASSIETNSHHHQAVKTLAPGLKVSARAMDGIIEGLESEDPVRFVLGVQFHPEGMLDSGAGFVRLFAALVQAAAPA